MTYSANQIEDFTLPLPITQTARSIAHQFATLQPTPQKAEQVWLNTLAVCVVNDYLQMMGIPCDVLKSDSWNPFVRLVADVADLEVTGVGRLECRPMQAYEQTCSIPAEVWEDRIGYVVVKINESFREAVVLGYTQTAGIEELPVSQLQPPEDLLDRLSQLMQPSLSPFAPSRTRVNLSQWLQDVFETGWQTVEAVLNPAPQNLAFSFRSANTFAETDYDSLDTRRRRAKWIDLGMQLNGHPVALVVEITPENRNIDILLQVHPTGNETYLPPLLQLTVLDESGATFLEAQARSADNYIQLEFSGNSGERFSVKVSLGDASIKEDFVL